VVTRRSLHLRISMSEAGPAMRRTYHIVIRWKLVIVIAGCIAFTLHAQNRLPQKPPLQPNAAKADSIKHEVADTTRHVVADSTRRALPDSLIHYFLPSLPGSLNQRLDSLDVVTRIAMEWRSARTLNQVLSSQPGVFGSEPSSVGQYFPLTMRGAGWRSNAVLIDGRPVADPASGIYNLSLFPMEQAERVEVITGPRSFLYGTGGAGGTLNIVTKTDAHRIPFTKIRYEEAIYNHTYSDGSFNQNLTRRSNLSFGYQYIGTDGRFLDSPHEQWNVRGAVRYHLLPKVSVILSELYAQTQTGLYGGINYPATGFQLAFDRRSARGYSTVAYEKLTRHDLDLRFIGMFLPDSTDLSTLAVYYSSNLREYRDEESNGSPYVQQDQRSSWYGLRAQQSASLGMHHISACVNVEVRQVEGSPTLGRLQHPSFSVWAMDEAAVTQNLHVAAYGRSEIFRAEQIAGFGADIWANLGGGLSLRGGASLAQRAPTYPELFWTDSSLARDGTITTEKHQLVEAGLAWGEPDIGNVRLMLAHRTITNPILTSPYTGSAPFPGVRLFNGDQIKTLTAELSTELHLFRYIMIEGTGTYLLRHDASGSTLDDYPAFWGEGGIYLAGTFFSDNLDLKAGVHGRVTTRYSGYLFSPPSLFMVPNTIASLGMGSTLDLVAIAHVGSAYVHIIWENVTNTTYFTSPFTPALDRAVRFGISWVFLN
jgi:TonB-dependent Receptor Plug Domain/Putative porin